jgi:hypothetical protein
MFVHDLCIFVPYILCEKWFHQSSAFLCTFCMLSRHLLVPAVSDFFHTLLVMSLLPSGMLCQSILGAIMTLSGCPLWSAFVKVLITFIFNFNPSIATYVCYQYCQTLAELSIAMFERTRLTLFAELLIFQKGIEIPQNWLFLNHFMAFGWSLSAKV